MIPESIALTLLYLQQKDLLSPAAQEVGKLIAKPFVLVNHITSKEMAYATKDAFIYICNRLSEKSKDNKSYIKNPNTKAICEVLKNLQWSYDDKNNVQTELMYEILWKLITKPTKEEDELFHTRVIDSLYLMSLQVLYLVQQTKDVILENNLQVTLQHNGKNINGIDSSSFSNDEKQKMQYLDRADEGDCIFKAKTSKIFANNIDISNKQKYFTNLMQNHLISNYKLNHEEGKQLVFCVNNKHLKSSSRFITTDRYKYYVTEQGQELLDNYYSDDVVKNISI